MHVFPNRQVLLLAILVLPGGSTRVFADHETDSAAVKVSLADESACVGDRTGHPQCVNRWAIASDNRHYDGYYVGGGLPVRGEQRCVFHEGTWGWDYFGVLFPKRIALHWGHGLRQQGGGGSYKTDGPKLLHK